MKVKRISGSQYDKYFGCDFLGVTWCALLCDYKQWKNTLPPSLRMKYSTSTTKMVADCTY